MGNAFLDTIAKIPKQLQDTVAYESGKFGLPLWITWPAILSESSGNPNAPGGGLLQIQSGYPGYKAGMNLADPATNLEIGLAPMADAFRAEGSPKDPSLQAYDYVLTHSGHNNWSGQFEAGGGLTKEQIQHNFESNFTNYQALTEPGHDWGGGVNVPNPVGDVAGAVSSGIGNAAGGVVSGIGGLAKNAVPHVIFISMFVIGLILLLLELKGAAT